MSDIVPMNTQNSCGNSSIEDLRKNFQNFVTLGSSFILNNGPDLSFCFSRFFLRSSASCTIERNLMNVNSFPCNHTLFCVKNTGHLLSNFINIPMITINGNNTMIAQNEIMISQILFSTIDRQSNLECLYSIATKLDIFSGL